MYFRYLFATGQMLMFQDGIFQQAINQAQWILSHAGSSPRYWLLEQQVSDSDVALLPLEQRKADHAEPMQTIIQAASH